MHLNMNSNLYTYSQSAPSRSRNGDHLRVYESDQLLLLALSDGVGGRPCDAEASALLCQTVLRPFEAQEEWLPWRQMLGPALQEAFQQLYDTDGPCKGMRATLTLLAYDKARNEMLYFGSGDSELLLLSEEEVELLTPTSSFEPALEQIPDKIQEFGPLAPGMAFALASDGFTDNRTAYRTELRQTVFRSGMHSRLDQLMALNRATQYDDITLTVLRFS